MKRFAGVLLLALGGMAAAVRWVDLTRLTDAQTGFALVGSVWARYGVLAVLVALAVVAGAMAVGRPAALERRSVVPGVCGIGCAALLAANAVVQLESFAGHRTVSGLPMGVLSAAAALWLMVLGLGWLRKEYALPATGVTGGIAGSLFFCAVGVGRFATNYSSYHRAGSVIAVASALFAILFSARLVRMAQYPESRPGRKLCFNGLACFYFATCMELPQAVHSYLCGTANEASLLGSVCMAAFGLLGAVCAMCCLGADRAGKEE